MKGRYEYSQDWPTGQSDRNKDAETESDADMFTKEVSDRAAF